MWDIDATDEYLEWFCSLDLDAQRAILTKVLLLEEFGPQLGRPHADTLKGSTIKNLKELRARTNAHSLRVLYYFNEERHGLLLIGGDKKGKNEKDFYDRLIQTAEKLIQRYRC
ncbi:type II toxin-antitoxin system RelE/ParE family toxin [Gracilinema caldarium]|uniref:Addiction module toxin RelE n=2 Tax=Gracilinema caldarium TaxID=215591 RepID=F8F3P9_GRAC1|nr:type II toxin-antitoxin system RelE/ParE family toxin [Gracilinema caldarium]AEJ19993.1 hypothetical protein Spica_1856 [Gracilinema caldarium DSM 7334]